MSLTMQLYLGVGAVLAMLGIIIWRSAASFDRDFPEKPADVDAEAERKRATASS